MKRFSVIRPPWQRRSPKYHHKCKSTIGKNTKAHKTPSLPPYPNSRLRQDGGDALYLSLRLKYFLKAIYPIPWLTCFRFDRKDCEGTSSHPIKFFWENAFAKEGPSSTLFWRKSQSGFNQVLFRDIVNGNSRCWNLEICLQSCWLPLSCKLESSTLELRWSSQVRSPTKNPNPHCTPACSTPYPIKLKPLICLYVSLSPWSTVMLSPPQPLDLKPFNLSTPIPIEASPALFFLCPAKAVLESDVWSPTRSLAACLPKISRVGSYSRSCDLDLERRAVDILSHGDMFDQPRVTPHLTIAIFLGFIENVKIALSSWLSVTDIGNERLQNTRAEMSEEWIYYLLENIPNDKREHF